MGSASSAGLEPWVECLRSVARRWSLRYLVLYGSRARGYYGPHSDTDVAVKVGRPLGFGDRGLLQVELEGCVGGKLDLVFIDDWSPLIAWEALAKGLLIYTCGPQCVREYYEDLTRAIDEVADLEPILELFRRETRRALARPRG